MIEMYKIILSPYMNALYKISDFVKSFNGYGTIHGSIVDIDSYNHIMLNPYDGSMTFYYSPTFGKIETHETLLGLLNCRAQKLVPKYTQQLKSSEHIANKNTLKPINELINIDIRNSIYSVSSRIKQLQRIFDKKVLRDWNDELLNSFNLNDSNSLLI